MQWLVGDRVSRGGRFGTVHTVETPRVWVKWDGSETLGLHPAADLVPARLRLVVPSLSGAPHTPSSS